jgi:hypothetical protein
MGNDLRNVSEASKAILLNKDAIAVSQDPLGQMGLRLTKTAAETQVWARKLSNGDVAVGLYNKDGSGLQPPFSPTSNCVANDWVHTVGSYDAGCSSDVTAFSDLSPAQALAACCANPSCAGFSITNHGATGSGYYKRDANCGNTTGAGYDGFTRKSAIPAAKPRTDANITVQFADPGINLFGEVEVFDIWAQKSLGKFTGSYTAKNVQQSDTAFLRLIGTK